MAIPKKIINFLEKSKIKYEVVNHRKVFTAIDKARTLKIKENKIGKTVILKADKLFFITLTSADRILNLDKINKIISARLDKKIKKISFASEKWIRENLKGMKQGMIPPFGVIWKLLLLVDKEFLKNSKLIINSGDHRQSIQLTASSLKKLLPEIVGESFSKKRPIKPKPKKPLNVKKKKLKAIKKKKK